MTLVAQGCSAAVWFGFDAERLLDPRRHRGRPARERLAEADRLRIGFVDPAGLGDRRHPSPSQPRPVAYVNHAGQPSSNGTTVEVATDQILELAVPFGRLGLRPSDPIRFYVELLEGDASLDRAPREGIFELTVPSPRLRADHVAGVVATIRGRRSAVEHRDIGRCTDSPDAVEGGSIMPELRKDPIVGRWVIIAHERAKRPHDFKRRPAGQPSRGVCPFCEGHEDKTPPEILAYRDAARGPTARAGGSASCPTSSPPCKIEGSLNKRGDGIYDMMAGVGAHEVIIESPDHHKSAWPTSAEDNIREVLWVYRDRLVDLKKDNRLVHGMLFKNVGAAGGASLEHTHSQLIVTPIVPISVWEEMTGVPRVLQLPRPLHLLRHGPAGARRREADRPRHAPLHRVLPLSPAGSRSRPGSCPRPTPATSRTSPSRASTTWAPCSARS